MSAAFFSPSGSFKLGGDQQNEDSFDDYNDENEDDFETDQNQSISSNLSWVPEFHQPSTNQGSKQSDDQKRNVISVGPGNRIISYFSSEETVGETDTILSTAITTFIHELHNEFKQLQQQVTELLDRVSTTNNDLLLHSSFSSSLLVLVLYNIN
jgi:hypothetical protein